MSIELPDNFLKMLAQPILYKTNLAEWVAKQQEIQDRSASYDAEYVVSMLALYGVESLPELMHKKGISTSILDFIASLDTQSEWVSIWGLLACQGQYSLVCQAIENKKFNPNNIMIGYTIWHIFAYNGHYDKVIQAIDDGLFNPETAIDLRGYTVWHMFLCGRHYDKFLQAVDERKIDLNIITDINGDTLWHHHIPNLYLDELIQAVVDKKFNAETTKNTNGETIWHLMAVDGYWDQLIQAAKNQLFNPDVIKDNQGNTVWSSLMLSVEVEDLKWLSEVINLGLNIDFADLGARLAMGADEYKKNVIKYCLNFDAKLLDITAMYDNPSLTYALLNREILNLHKQNDHNSTLCKVFKLIRSELLTKIFTNCNELKDGVSIKNHMIKLIIKNSDPILEIFDYHILNKQLESKVLKIILLELFSNIPPNPGESFMRNLSEMMSAIIIINNSTIEKFLFANEIKLMCAKLLSHKELLEEGQVNRLFTNPNLLNNKPLKPLRFFVARCENTIKAKKSHDTKLEMEIGSLINRMQIQ